VNLGHDDQTAVASVSGLGGAVARREAGEATLLHL